ncbi:hypothetical protein, partial [Secundilactobacillus silagincola]
ITVSQNNDGDYSATVADKTVSVSRTASVDENGQVVYTDWTVDGGTGSELVPELTAAATAVKGFQNTVDNGGAYSSADFKAVTDAGKPGDEGYTTTVTRTVHYTKNQA